MDACSHQCRSSTSHASRSKAGHARSLPIMWNRLEGAAAITRRESSLSSRFTMWLFPRTREGLQLGRPVPSFSSPVPWSRPGAAAATAQLVPARHNNDHQSDARRFSSRRRSQHPPSACALVNCPPHDWRVAPLKVAHTDGGPAEPMSGVSNGLSEFSGAEGISIGGCRPGVTAIWSADGARPATGETSPWRHQRAMPRGHQHAPVPRVGHRGTR